MSDIKLNISIKEENNILFKRCVRKLLESTFIIEDKDEKLYAFISRESNRQDISDYLRMIGFDVLVDTNVRIAMLKTYEADEDAVGLKRANIVTFTTEQYHLLLVLWEIYMENLGYNEENVVLLGDLIDKFKAYEVDIDSRKLSAAMELFKKYNLIDFDTRDKSEDAIVTLYPSLQFGWDVAQFQAVSAEYMKDGESVEDQEESDEEEEEE
ncbi:DUF4194 domain-containing protein [Anaerocolumna jejuensis]|uniref:DUF4194 domain-containing protein n=1 Tax=Anaerocolumna jejuensis TaxID=259063 RepID=UPI003F7B75BD